MISDFKLFGKNDAQLFGTSAQSLVLVLFMLAPLWAASPYQPTLVDPISEPWRWRSFPEIEGQGLLCLVEGKDGALWFGMNDGVKRYDGKAWITYTPEDGVLGAPVNALCATRDGRIYAGSEWGISLFQNGKWQRIFPVHGDLHWPVDRIIETSDGDIWAGSTWGVLLIRGGQLILYTTEKVKQVLGEKFKNVSFKLVPESVTPNRAWPDGAGIRISSGHWFGLGRGYNPAVVWDVAPGGPGARAGVLVGDRILEINHQKDIMQSSLDGKADTEVVLTLWRDGGEAPFDVQITRDVVPGTFHDFSVYDIFEASDRALWFGLSSGSRGGGEVVRLLLDGSAERWQIYTETDGLQIGYGPRIIEAKDGLIWTISQESSKGINRFDGKMWESYRLSDFGGNNTNTDLITTQDGTLWVGGHRYLHAFRDGQWTAYKAFDYGFPDYRHRLLETNDGALWVAGLGQAVTRLDYDTDRWKTYRDVIVQCETPDKNLWFLNHKGEAICYTGNAWVCYGIEDGFLDAASGLYVTRAGTLWAVGSHKDIAASAQFDGNTWTMQLHPQLSWGLNSRAFFEDFDGNIWIGAAAISDKEKQFGGLLKFSPQVGSSTEIAAWTHFLPPETPQTIYGITQTADGLIWICGWWGVRYFDGKTWALPDNEALWAAPVDVLATDPKGHLWVGTRNNGVFNLKGKTWIHYGVKDGISEGRVRHVLPEEGGHVWVVTSKGMSYFDGQIWTIKTHHHLPEDPVLLWSSQKGVFWINVIGGEWLNRAFPASQYMYAGIQTIRYEQEQEPPDTKIVVSIDQVSQPGNLVISWAGEDAWKTTQPENIQYAWRLDGNEWTPFSFEQSKVFFELPRGDHTFEVKARDQDLNEDPTPAFAQFTVLPPVWLQTWFIGMVLVFVGCIGFLTVRVMQRGRQLKDANAVLEKRVLERTAELERSNQDLQNFASIASHDLQEPLRKVTVFSGLLKSEFGDKLAGDGEMYLSYVVDSTMRMQNLIRDLLAYSRVTIKASAFDLVNLNKIADEVISDLHVRIEETNGRVKVGDLPTIEADELHMRQLFQNLIGNSLKFHREGVPPVVQVSGEVFSRSSNRTKANGACCELVFSDNGIGFEEKYEEHVFEVFQRLHSREEFEGTGIGLALCQKIAVRHGGTITAKSKIGKGTSFSVSLPMKQGKHS